MEERHMASNSAVAQERANQRNAVIAAFLGWMLDAFDFFILVMVMSAVARDFHRTIPAIALTLTASLATRPLGALIFGLMADRYGRRLPLMLDIVLYSLVEVLSGLAPTYTVFLILRLIYGIGMGGEWGVGASLAMESIPPKWRGIVSGLLQEGYAAGYLLAAVVYYFVFPHWGWRPMFFIGGLPALLSLFIRAKVKESRVWHASRMPWATYYLFGRADGRHELHVARHTGSLSHLPEPSLSLQRADDGDHYSNFHDRCNLWGTIFRPNLRHSGTAACDGDRGSARSMPDSLLDT